jgi:hypothetical protein
MKKTTILHLMKINKHENLNNNKKKYAYFKRMHTQLQKDSKEIADCIY